MALGLIAEGGSPGVFEHGPGLPPSAIRADAAQARPFKQSGTSVVWPLQLASRLVADPQLQEATAIESITPLDGGRLMAILHVNPTTQVAVVIDAGGQTYRVYRGNTFTWDLAQRHLAWLVDAGDEGANPATELWLDGKCIERKDIDSADVEIRWGRVSAALALVASAR